MIETINVPIIEICDGWTVDEIFNEDDCDDAFSLLTAFCVDIEARMDDLCIQGNELSVEFKRAKSALRWKKAALSVVNIKRGKIRRAEKDAENADFNKRVNNYFRAMHPDEFRKAQDHVVAGTDHLIAQQDAS